jgi:hypothetical protein
MKLYDLVIIGSGTAAQVASSRVSSVLGRRHACGPPERVRTILEGGDVSLADAKYEAELKAVTKKHGFRNFAEYEAVAAQISSAMASIDPQSKVFTAHFFLDELEPAAR